MAPSSSKHFIYVSQISMKPACIHFFFTIICLLAHNFYSITGPRFSGFCILLELVLVVLGPFTRGLLEVSIVGEGKGVGFCGMRYWCVPDGL